MVFFLQAMRNLEKCRIFVLKQRRSLHIAKYRIEQKSARFRIVTYIESFFNNFLIINRSHILSLNFPSDRKEQ